MNTWSRDVGLVHILGCLHVSDVSDEMELAPNMRQKLSDAPT